MSSFMPSSTTDFKGINQFSDKILGGLQTAKLPRAPICPPHPLLKHEYISRGVSTEYLARAETELPP